jgi:threonine/homoserine/homoserine lactone efflux protein
MEHFLIILGITWLAVISPGADFAMVSRLSAVQGRQAGMLAAAGIAAGCWFHVAYAIFGIALMERLFPQALIIIQIAGAAYLIYLGVTMAFARPAAVVDGAPLSRSGGYKAFATGVLTNGLNPKTAMFVVGLYAQVIGRDMPILAQVGYGAAISVSHLLWFCAVAIFLSQPAVRSHVLANQRLVNGVIGFILCLLGVALAVADIGRHIVD